jgi:hypothetical protein
MNDSMSDIHLPPTQSTPAIDADSAAGLLVMQGDSYPENSFQFFAPVIGWVESYLASGAAPLQLQLKLLYLNTSSVKAMMDIFDLLEAAHVDGKPVSVTWYYDTENPRVAELAEEFKEDCSFSFEIVAGEPQA